MRFSTSLRNVIASLALGVFLATSTPALAQFELGGMALYQMPTGGDFSDQVRYGIGTMFQLRYVDDNGIGYGFNLGFSGFDLEEEPVGISQEYYQKILTLGVDYRVGEGKLKPTGGVDLGWFPTKVLITQAEDRQKFTETRFGVGPWAGIRYATGGVFEVKFYLQLINAFGSTTAPENQTYLNVGLGVVHVLD